MVNDGGTKHTAENRFGYPSTHGFASESTNGHPKPEEPSESGDPPGVTLERYAAAKRLPVDFLKSINLKDATYDFGPAVRIPYPDGLGREAYYRYRVSMRDEPRFKAPPKHVAPNPIPYGLHVLSLAREQGYVWITEGESDTQVLWFIDEPALGIPGVQSWVKYGPQWSKHLHGIPLILVPSDYDPAGEKLFTMLSSNEELGDRVRKVEITSPELKDVGALWVDAVDSGNEKAFKGAIRGQVYFHSRSRSLSRNGNGNEAKTAVHRLRVVSFTGRSKPPPREWVVKDAIPSGHASSWYGAGGVAKSYQALYLATCIASPKIREWAGQAVVTAPVIYGDFELDQDEHLIRAKQIAAGMGLDDVPDDLYYLGMAGLPSRQALAVAAEECERLKAGLFILDSVGYALAGDAELSRDVIRFFREEIQAIKNTGATPLLIDHQAKVVKGEKYSDKQEFGSVYKTNSVRSSFQVRGSWEENTMTATFRHKKHNMSPPLDDFSLRLTFAGDEVRVEKLDVAEADPDKQPTSREKILLAWEEIGEGTASTVAQITDINLKTVRNHIPELVESELLEDTGRKDKREAVYSFVPGPIPTKGTGTGTNEKPPSTHRLIDTNEGLLDLADEVSRSTEPVALDTETSSLQVNEAKARLIQVRAGNAAAPAVVDCEAVDQGPLLEALADKHIIGHNLPYDLAVLYGRYGYEHRGPVSDTMVMFQVFYCGTSKPYGLQDAIKAMLGVEIDKTHQDSDWFGDLTPEMFEYAAKDVLYLHDLRDAILEKVDEKADHLRPVMDLENRMVKVTAHMSAVGMPVDEDVLAECIRESRENADRKLAELDALVDVELPEDVVKRNTKNKKVPEERNDKVNWNSPDQILWAFEAVAGLKLEGTDKETLPAVDHPMAVALLEYRQALDVYKRFRETKVVDGRVYAKWNQLKAKTGRMSCEKPPLQGIPKPLRRAFVAPDGHALVVSDLSQIEIRVLAALCGDERLLSDLAAGRDMHRTAAASVFGKDYEAVTDAERKLCKGLVFGTLYGMGLNGFTARVNAWTGKKYSPDEVDRRFRKPLFAAYPKVQKWMDRTLKAHEDGKTVAYTPLGRRRLQVSSGPEALNTPIQAGALDVMKAIACAAYERRSELSTAAVQIVGLVHDEVVVVAPDDHAAEVEDWLGKIMRTVGEKATNLDALEGRRVPVEAGTKICRTWAEKE